MTDHCHSEAEKKPATSSCCAPPAESDHCGDSCAPKARIDWLLWGSLAVIIAFYGLHLVVGMDLPAAPWATEIGHSVFSLINTMWWSLLLAAVFVGVIGRIPQELVMSVLGRGGSTSGLFRATGAGLLLDLCSHGILMVGMQLYQRGASIGQVMAFLIASPWNSLSLTFVLIALIGLPWTLAFIALSAVIAWSTGWMFDRLVAVGKLPENPNTRDLPANFRFWSTVKSQWRGIQWSPGMFWALMWDGIKGSRMVLRWLLFGVVLASLIRAFVPLELFQQWFGPSLVGLALTLVAATIIEVCSEGSTPIAADLLNRGGAPGNGFTFLMTGVATDYTEIMSIKDTTASWKLALFLPLLTVPQVLVVGWLLNTFGT